MEFDWHNPYPTVRSPVFARNVVATSQPLAAQAGLSMLKKGGNAVDAAIAAAAAMTIVEPVSNGLGSDNFALVWDGQKLSGLNSSGFAPEGWTPEYFKRKHGERMPERGWDTVTVPGAVAGWAALSERYGSLPFGDLLEPAIDLAERGHGVATIVARKWGAQAPILAAQPGFAEAFMPRGRAPHPGERFVFADAGRTLRAIAASRGEEFYRGELAARIAARAAASGAVLTAEDLAAYEPEWVEPITCDYAGYTVHEIPPNGQGIAALMALGMLSEFDLAELGADSVASLHLQIESMKLAFADVYRWVADPNSMRQVTVSDLLDPEYLKRRAHTIDRQRAQAFESGQRPRGGTIYLTAADSRGMMVSFIQSNYMGFGSGVVVSGTGISLQNRGHGFTLDANHPNVVGPRKRPFHTIIPAFLTRAGQPQMSFGVMGGNMQPQGHLQTLVRMLQYHQQPQAACDAPRWKLDRGLALDCESTMAPDAVAGLRALGHRIESKPDPYMDFGSGQFIWRMSDDLEDGYVAASDSRRDGQVAAY